MPVGRGRGWVSAVTTLVRWRAILGHESSSGMSPELGHRRSATMRIRNYITPLLVAAAAAAAIAAAPTSMADPTTAKPAVNAPAPTTEAETSVTTHHGA